jgi:phage baseplate assembly protein V
MLPIARDDQRTSGVGSREATDQARRLHNLIRYGVVAEVDYTGDTADYPAIRVSLQDGELTSDWIPWATLRAGNDRVWDPPEVGEVVLLLSSSGELANALALPAVFSDGNQNGDRAGLHRRTYQDGTIIEYDREEHTLTIDTTESTGSVIIRTGAASIEASGAVTVQAQGQVSISGSTVRLNP